MVKFEGVTRLELKLALGEILLLLPFVVNKAYHKAKVTINHQQEIIYGLSICA